ncbi:MAG: DNA polymerase III subunit alpha [Bacteroidales bacterium]|nr:DNA polymerase III subunit alpha [Bacteroidales bacterium]
MPFVHLHLHTQYSILDGLTDIKKLFARARELGMPALAITDHGNMYGVKEFLKWAYDKSNKNPDGSLIVKPIIGCEVYVTRHYDHRLKDNDHKDYYHLILLAKNYNGYKNLMKIVSAGFIDGFYRKPRVTHEIIEQYHQDLVCSSACLAGEISKNLMAGNYEGAKKAAEWHRKVFGEDYYLEVMLHKTEVRDIPQESYDKVYEVFRQQTLVCEGIFRLAEETGIKVVATNDVHFLNREDGPVHDRLICLTTNANISDPGRLRYTQQEFLKSEEEMSALFPEHPEALANTLEVAGKIEAYSIDRPHVLPKFEIDPKFMSVIDNKLEQYKEIIDEGRYSITKDKATGREVREYRGDAFCNSVAYLCELCYRGAHARYGETLSEEQQERIEFELKTICKMGFPDYFLIVQDYIAASRKHGYLVGPGRGSAAGSVVAYCLGITNLDPIKYNLLFERFLNPDRISMPDIDVDFENLLDAHEYVEKTYGSDHVSRVITFGTMAAKSAIKDVARISEVSIDESNRLTKMIPDRLSEKKEKKYPFNPKLDEIKPGFKVVEEEIEIDGVKQKRTFQKGMEDVDVKITLANCYRLVPELKNELENGTDIIKEVLNYAQRLEGSIRQVGMHACATIIGRGNLTDYIPICLSKDKETGKDVWTSQYDGHYIEDVGMLKMDFLGLITLSIIHETLRNIKQRHGTDIDIEAIPIDDRETLELYGRGDTTVVFQFESEGMKSHLQRLRPERFEDLIAMNALYRPGPMDYIPDFIARKQGTQKIEYDLPEMEEYLAETYGITVYQEQVMLLSRKLASFTKGEADRLRKAMGKKKIDEMMVLKDKFMSQGQANGHPEKILDKIWKDWEKFAQYAFNKSHATCYAWVSYQTGWLKCHYTAEFLAANLSCNLGNMDEIKKIMADCKLHGIKVLSPDVNESEARFTVNRAGNIRFGLGGLKNFGSNVVDAIIAERAENGLFSDIYDFVERMATRSAKDSKTVVITPKSVEILALAGAFDSFGYKRSQFFCLCSTGERFIDALIRYMELYKNDKMDNSLSLFGEIEEMKPQRPEVPAAPEEENTLELLQEEKNFVGMYLSAHPLDRYSFEIENFTNLPIGRLQDKIQECEKDGKKFPCAIAGIVTDVKAITTKSGSPGARVTVEDYSGHYEFALFGKDYEAYMAYMRPHEYLYVQGDIDERYFIKPEERAQGKTAPYTLKIKKVLLLGNVADTFVSGITVDIDTALLNADFRKRFKGLLKEFEGKTPLSVALHDSTTGYNLEFHSKKFPVAVTSELIGKLKMLGLQYSVQKKAA